MVNQTVEIKLSILAAALLNLVFLITMIPASSWALVAATVVCFFETLDFHTIWRVLATSQVAGRAFSVIESSLNSRRNSCEGWRMGKIILKQFNIHRPAPLLYGQRTRACNWSQRAFWLHRVQEGLGAVLLPTFLYWEKVVEETEEKAAVGGVKARNIMKRPSFFPVNC